MAVDDHGLEVLRKSASEVTPGDKSSYYLNVKLLSTPGDYVETIVAGSGISVDSTDPANPIVSATGGETATSIGTLVNSLAEKSTPIDADMIGLMDSEATNIWKKLSWTNVKATLKTYFDALYPAKLTPTTVKTSNYTAAVNDIVQCDVSTSSFVVTLPGAPADKSLIKVGVVKIGTGTVEVKCSGSDRFRSATGPTSIYLDINVETASLQYNAGPAIWVISVVAAPLNFATNFPGIDESTPITNADISINDTTRVLTITPAIGAFNIIVDGLGKVTRYRKETVNFPAFTDTSGMWYFYFDASGAAITTQAPWTTAMFESIVTVYRLLWNSSLSGPARIVSEYVEYHLNNIPADAHEWFHLQGTQWGSGFTMANNALISGAPNADGRNAVIALSTGSNIDDNLEYTVTNSTLGIPWNQDLGNITPASLNATNAALFQIFVQGPTGLISFLPATRFPFPWDSGTNAPQFVSATGTRTAITNQNFMTVFIYATQNPRTGEALKVITATSQFTSLTNARAYGWTDILSSYTVLAGDPEVRPLYRLIFEVHTAVPVPYDVGSKYSVLRETQDLRKTPVTSTSTATGSLPASSVVFTPVGNVSSTNVQAAIEELDLEKGNVTMGMAYTISTGQFTP